jgi:hemerythrin
MMQIIHRPFESEARPGLESTQETVSREHLQLSDLLAELVSACAARRDAELLRSLFEELREALEAHFSREESLYYPTVWALRPDLEQSLRSLIRAHDVFRAQLADVDAALAAGSHAELSRLLVDFGDLFTQHERAEESQLRDLTEAARPGA